MHSPVLRISQPGPCRRPRVVLALLALALPLALGGCGQGPEARAGGGALLTVGARRAAPPPARLRSGAALARRAASAYARGAYRRRPPRLLAETPQVAAALAAAAKRVPRVRRGLHPALLGLEIWAVAVDRMSATARIGDGRFPPFTVGIELGRRRRWIVVAVSLPD